MSDAPVPPRGVCAWFKQLLLRPFRDDQPKYEPLEPENLMEFRREKAEPVHTLSKEEELRY